jgi:predicted RNase H-like nuclease
LLASLTKSEVDADKAPILKPHLERSLLSVTEEHGVLGVDAWKKGWVGVSLVNGRFSQAMTAPKITDLLFSFRDTAVAAIDIPIGLPITRPRECDSAARAFVGPRRSSVFPTPPKAALEAATFQEAIAACRRVLGVGLSQQSYALGPKILEVALIAVAGDKIIEVHPEVCFRAMAGRVLAFSKSSWAGMRERLKLLAEADIELPGDLGMANEVGPADVIDAAAAAWSARRYLRGEAMSVINPPELSRDGRQITIWY